MIRNNSMSKCVFVSTPERYETGTPVRVVMFFSGDLILDKKRIGLLRQSIIDDVVGCYKNVYRGKEFFEKISEVITEDVVRELIDDFFDAPPNKAFCFEIKEFYDDEDADGIMFELSIGSKMLDMEVYQRLDNARLMREAELANLALRSGEIKN